MKRYLWRRAGGFLLTALLVSFATFFIIQVLPGDPALLMLGTEGSPEAYVRLRQELGLHQPLLQRYVQWIINFMGGQWGNSWRYSLPVRELVGQAFPLSFALAMLAVGMAALAALPAGMYMAVQPRRLSSRLLSLATQLVWACPSSGWAFCSSSFLPRSCSSCQPGGVRGGPA